MELTPIYKRVIGLDARQPGCPGHLKQLAPDGFVVDGHELTLYGQFRDCAEPT